ncbi:MAG TPA: VWA domain-containing protein [Flavobacteriales bacterium]|nr:VWA domain-containing protein [Flavobacteriales bacterium]
MEQLRLANLEYTEALWIMLGATLLLSIVFWLMQRWKKRTLALFGTASLIGNLMPDVSRTRPVFKFILLLLSLWLIIIGIANPQIGSKMEEVKREGVDIIIALDLSNSMLAEDIKPNRLTRAILAVSKLIDKLQGDRIGLIVFGGEAYVQLPITTDYSAAKLFLSTISTDIMPTQGTAIGAAIELAVQSFGSNDLEGQEETKKTIIVITDGENHEDDAIEQAQLSLEKNITIHTIGMGLSKGGPIPIYRRGIQTGYRKDKAGNTVISKLNETMLQQIAVAGGGSYIRANNIQTGLVALFSELNKMEKVNIGSKVFTDYEDRFQYFLGLAIILLFLEFFVGEKKNKYLRRIKLFD